MQHQQEIKDHMEECKMGMGQAIEHLQNELIKIRTGKANSSMLGSIQVDYYGSMTPLTQVANVSTSDSRTLVIQPWEKSMLAPIEKAIFEANLGYTPQNDGELVRISIPPLTEERRVDLAKMAKGLGEEAKVSIRNERHKAMEFIKKMVKENYPEDMGKRREEEVQNMTNDYGKKVDSIIEAKEKEIMTV